MVQKRFQFPEGTVELYAEKVNNRGLCAIAQAESLRYKLLGGLAVRRFASATQLCCYELGFFLTSDFCNLYSVFRIGLRADFFSRSLDFRACYGVLRFIMESGAKGCEVLLPPLLNAFLEFYVGVFN